MEFIVLAIGLVLLVFTFDRSGASVRRKRSQQDVVYRRVGSTWIKVEL